eukprot:2647498-Pleurochrysis_carterae.AAC.1
MESKGGEVEGVMGSFSKLGGGDQVVRVGDGVNPTRRIAYLTNNARELPQSVPIGSGGYVVKQSQQAVKAVLIKGNIPRLESYGSVLICPSKMYQKCPDST